MNFDFLPDKNKEGSVAVAERRDEVNLSNLPDRQEEPSTFSPISALGESIEFGFKEALRDTPLISPFLGPRDETLEQKQTRLEVEALRARQETSIPSVALKTATGMIEWPLQKVGAALRWATTPVRKGIEKLPFIPEEYKKPISEVVGTLAEYAAYSMVIRGTRKGVEFVKTVPGARTQQQMKTFIRDKTIVQIQSRNPGISQKAAGELADIMVKGPYGKELVKQVQTLNQTEAIKTTQQFVDKVMNSAQVTLKQINANQPRVTKTPLASKPVNVTKTPIVAPVTPPVVEEGPLSVLAQEAKKYKTVREFLKESTLVDTPGVFWHGSTRKGLTGLRTGEGNLGKGVYLTTSPREAQSYAAGWAGGVLPGDLADVTGKQIYQVNLKNENLFKTDEVDLSSAEIADIKKTYAGIQTPYETVIFNPKDIEIKGTLAGFHGQAVKPAKAPVTPTEKAKETIEPEDISPVPPPTDFPGVGQDFLDLPKKKPTLLQYFTPAEFQMKKYGFDPYIGQPMRAAMREFRIELADKVDNLNTVRDAQLKDKTPEQQTASLKKLKDFVNKEAPAPEDKSPEAEIARTFYRVETEEMFNRINEINEKLGKPKIKKVQNYMYNMVKEEILEEMYENGKISPELARIMTDKAKVSKDVFLATALERKGIPDDWVVDDPYQAMRAMYAIDLKYVHLQDAMAEIEPFLTAVEKYKSPDGTSWDPAVFDYLTSWVNHGIKMRPSSLDKIVDNTLDAVLSPLFNKVKALGERPTWRQITNFLSAAQHAGALSLRAKAVLRNLTQTNLDIVNWGIKSYTKAFAMRFTQEGHDILMQSKLYRTRTPIEAQDLTTMNKALRLANIPYKWSDIVNVRQSILTTYTHARDVLKYDHDKAIQFADDNVPASQWSYLREDMPQAFWTSTGGFLFRLGSWWMNFTTRFVPEMFRKAFTGKAADGREVPPVERLAILRFFVLLGIYEGVKRASKAMLGVAIDYTRQLAPSPSISPSAQLLEGSMMLAQGVLARNDEKINKGLNKIANAAFIHIPFYLSGKDLYNVLSGKKEPLSLIFYTNEEDLKQAKFQAR